MFLFFTFGISRFTDAEVISNLGVLDTSQLETLPPMYGMAEMEALAEYFSLDQDDLLVEWNGLCEIIQEHPRTARSLDGVYKLICGSTNEHLGLQTSYPLCTQLYAIALTLPISTAEVERIFSQLALIKTDHRNRMKEVTLQRLINLKINMKNVDMCSIVKRAAMQWLNSKDRRLTKSYK